MIILFQSSTTLLFFVVNLIYCVQSDELKLLLLVCLYFSLHFLDSALWEKNTVAASYLVSSYVFIVNCVL